LAQVFIQSYPNLILGKKNTKIYKAEHIPTGKFYAIKEVEAKTLDKLNEYKVIQIKLNCFFHIHSVFRKKQYSCLKFKIIQMCYNSLDIISMKQCTTLLELLWFVNIWIIELT